VAEISSSTARAAAGRGAAAGGAKASRSSRSIGE
jgi:hypothetical protein